MLRIDTSLKWIHMNDTLRTKIEIYVVIPCLFVVATDKHKNIYHSLIEKILELSQANNKL